MRRPLYMLPAPTALAALAALTALGALGCEDGPAQTYTAAPPNAGNIWNSGNVPTVTPDAGQGYDAGYPQQSKTVLCDTDFKRQRWAWMLTQNISPPRHYAGIDLAKDDLWDGLTIGEAEAPPTNPTADGGGLCQSVPAGFQGGCPSGFGSCNGSSWGNAGEVSFSWNVATDLIDQMVLNLGYTGSMITTAYPDHTGEPHAWKITIGDIIRRDELPFEIDWGTTATAQIQITDIFNAVMNTFAVVGGVPFNSATCTDDSTCQAPGQVNSCQCTHTIVGGKATSACDTTIANNKGQCGVTNCGTDGNCLVYNAGGTTIFGIRPMVVYIEGASGVPQPALSTPTLIYNFFSKWEPFSNLPQVVKLDAEGPVAQGDPVGDPTGKLTCKQIIGQTFGDFTTNCVAVTGVAAVDTVNVNKVTHGLTHDQEHWAANVLGVNQNFTSLKVANNPAIVVQDSDTPQTGDIAQDWTFDSRARGAVANDYTADPGGNYRIPGDTISFAGSGLVMIEWSRLLLADIRSQMVASGMVIPSATNPQPTLGDPRCTGITGGVPNYQIANKSPGTASYVGCSGLEGMILPNSATTYGGPALDYSNDPVTLPNIPAGGYPGINADAVGGLFQTSILKPGDNSGAFCIDPGVESDCTYNGGFSMFQNALVHVTRVLGGGVQANLPPELQDRRYYFKLFGVAYIKYLKAYGNFALAKGIKVNQFPDGSGNGLAPSDVDRQQIDLESLFFDYANEGSGTFDKFEYIDREFIGSGSGGAYNIVPYDFEYGCDLLGGNQRYDNWYRRMDREEIGMFSAMLTNKAHSPGQENNVNITNLFGSVLLGGDPSAGVAGLWPSYACAIGQAGDPAANCVNTAIFDTINNNYLYTNAPLSTVQSGAACGANGACPIVGGIQQVCSYGWSFENGQVSACGNPCDFTGGTMVPGASTTSGCVSPTQTCAALYSAFGAGEGCLDMKMDKNGANVPASGAPGYNAAVTAQPLLANYAGAWGQTPFSRGHSPITLAQADKQPNIGVAKITIPNFAAGPYTVSPVQAAAGATPCSTGYTVSTDGAWCNANLLPVGGTTPTTQPSFTPLTPWAEVQPAVGFSIPLDGQHNQFVSTGQLDFSGVLETYIVDYVPYVDPAKSACISDGDCNKGFTCAQLTNGGTGTYGDGGTDGDGTHACVTSDNTISISAIEGADFLGQAFLCMDPATFDVLHVGMYDSGETILNWFAAHPGVTTGNGPTGSAQAACQVIFIRSPYDNYIDYIVSKQYGVLLNMGGGQGQGRVTDIVLFDTGLIQSL